MKILYLLVVLFSVFSVSIGIRAMTLEILTRMELPLDIAGRDVIYDISGIAMCESFLMVASDEGSSVQLLSKSTENGRLTGQSFNIRLSMRPELDAEAIACQGDTVFVTGSHSKQRSLIRRRSSVERNYNKLYAKAIPQQSAFEGLYRIDLKMDGQVVSNEKINLRYVLEKHEILRAYFHLPSMENGINAEGLAVREDTLFVGFRSPVFRGNLVPVLPLHFDSLRNPDDFDDYRVGKLLFVDLDGRGIRSLESVRDGFLLIAGSTAYEDVSSQLVFWDGKNGLLDQQYLENGNGIIVLGEIPTVGGEEPEGLTILSEDSEYYTVLVVYDGIINGSATVFHIQKP